MIMRFRPANIRLINRRSNLPRLLLALSSGKSKNNDNNKNNPIDSAELTGSLHIRPNRYLTSWLRLRGSNGKLATTRLMSPDRVKMTKSGIWRKLSPSILRWTLFR